MGQVVLGWVRLRSDNGKENQNSSAASGSSFAKLGRFGDRSHNWVIWEPVRKNRSFGSSFTKIGRLGALSQK